MKVIKPAKGRFKGLIAPMIIVALISSLLTGGIRSIFYLRASTKYSGANPPGNTYISENGGIKQIEIIDETTTSAETAVAEKVSPSIVGINITYEYRDMFFGSSQNQGQGSELYTAVTATS